MKISKIKIKNLFGIKEYETGGQCIELSGENGTGKTSVVDAIRYALTNKSEREYIVRNGETEGEIIVETDNGIRISRKARTNQADYKSVKKDGREVGSPESFLKDIFTPLQLSPVEFMAMGRTQQNAVILDMIEYPWSIRTIKEWFGEIPDWVSYDQNILQVLNDVQSEKGQYYQTRQDINRDIRNKRAFVEDIAYEIPPGYNADKWEQESLGELYQKIEQIRSENEKIERAKALVENRDNRIRKFEADKEIAIAALEKDISASETRLKEKIASLEEQIKSCKSELYGLEERKADKMEAIESAYRANVATYDTELSMNREYAEKEPAKTVELQEKARHAEDMKKHLNEYRRMKDLQREIDELTDKSAVLTERIEKARELPGEILQTAKIPIDGLSVVNGVPLINGLPISNLSDGEKLDLCIDVALQKPNGLQIILIDGVEKLSAKLRERLYAKCKNAGLQFIATRTTDDNELTVMEL